MKAVETLVCKVYVKFPEKGIDSWVELFTQEEEILTLEYASKLVIMNSIQGANYLILSEEDVPSNSYRGLHPLNYLDKVKSDSKYYGEVLEKVLYDVISDSKVAESLPETLRESITFILRSVNLK